ncbi:hypothetical protein [Halocatena marina]
MLANRDILIEQAIQHLNIALTGLFVGVILWGTAGVIIHRYDRFSDVTLGVFGVILTIPSQRCSQCSFHWSVSVSPQQ